MKKIPLLPIILFVLTASLFTGQAVAADRVYLDISAQDTRKIRFAVPWFVNKDLNNKKQRLGKELADILAKSLKFHGIISIIPTRDYNGSQHADWKNLDADFVIFGNYRVNAKGIQLEMRLFDVAGNENMIGKAFSGTIKQKDQMLFKFCDQAIKELTGTSGIAATQIAFISQKGKSKEVYITDILGRKLRQVTRHNAIVVSPRFVPNSTKLSYTSYHSGNPNLYVTDLRQNKTTLAISRRKGMNLAPAWSPDGEKMILTLSVNGNPDLYLLDKKGRILKQLTKRSGINVSPTWSPDGTKIAFVSDRANRRPQIFIMDLQTQKTFRLTYEGAENAEPSWSPNGDLLVYSSLRNGVYQLCTIAPVPGAKATQITTDLSHHESPVWSPDGNQILFAKRDGKKHQIYAIMKNGTFQRRVLAFSMKSEKNRLRQQIRLIIWNVRSLIFEANLMRQNAATPCSANKTDDLNKTLTRSPEKKQHDVKKLCSLSSRSKPRKMPPLPS